MSTQIRGNKQIKNITIQNGQIADGNIELGKLREGSELIKRDGSVAFTDNVDLGSNQLKNVGEPVDANDAVRKADLDAVTNGSSVFREIPTGTVNGNNTSFSLTNTPNLGTEQVFLNGSLLNAGANSDYVLEGSTLTFTLAPQVGDVILVNYITDAIVVSLDVSNTINQLNSRLTTAEGELFDAQTDISTLTSDLSGVTGRVTTAEADIVAVEGDVVSLQSSLSSLQSTVSSVQSSVSSEQAARIAADDLLDTAVGSLQTSVTSLGNRMNTAESDIVALENADLAFDVRAGVIEDGLQSETSARQSADSALSSRVTNLENAPAPVTSYNDLTDKPSLFDGAYASLSGKPSLFSGSYDDLSNKPTIALAGHQWSANHTIADGTRYLIGDIVYDNGNIYVANYENESIPTSNTLYWTNLGPGKRINIDGRDIQNIQYAQLSGKPSLFSGSYNDLSNKPSLFDGAYASLAGKPTIYTPVKEVPSGDINGTNVTFVISDAPAVAGTEQVFLNGLLQFSGAGDDYTISGGTITFNTAPETGWKLVVYYSV